MKLVILGRDGVIIERRDQPVSRPEDCVPKAGCLDAITRLCQAGYHIIVAVSETGLESSRIDVDALARIHHKLQLSVATTGGHLDAIFFPSEPDLDTLPCDPGSRLLEEIATRLQLSLKDVPVVGDTVDVIRAARAIAAKPIFLRTGSGGAKEPAQERELAGAQIFDDLPGFVEWFLAGQPSDDAGAEDSGLP